MIGEKMNCQRVADDELVERYLNGQLDAALQDDLEVHILACPHCLARAEGLSAARASLAQRAHEIRLLPAKNARRLRLAWLGAAAALVAVCGLAWYQFRLRSPQPQQQTATHTQSVQNLPVSSTLGQINSINPQENSAQAHVASDKQGPGQKHPVLAGTSKKPEANPPEIAKRSKTEQVVGESVTANSQVTGEQHNDQKTGTASTQFAKHKNSPMQMSEEQAVELYSLAAVQPPAYVFPGVAANATPPVRGAGAPGAGATQGFAAGAGAGGALFQSAMVEYVEKRYNDAADKLETIVTGEPKAADANFYLGICRLMQGQPRQSIAPLRAVLDAPAGRLTQSAHFYLAKAYLQMSNLAQAEEEMQAAAAIPGRLTAEARSVAARIEALRKSTSSESGGGQQKPN